MKEHIDQWNGTENFRDKPCIYGILIYDESGTGNQWEKDGLFSREKELTTWAKKKTGTLLNTMFKSELKIHERIKCER